MKLKKVTKEILLDIEETHPDDMETTEDGELIIYTGIYRHSDHTYHRYSEKSVTAIQKKIIDEFK